MASASAVPSRNAVAYLTISSYCLRISSQSIGRNSTGCRLGYASGLPASGRYSRCEWIAFSRGRSWKPSSFVNANATDRLPVAVHVLTVHLQLGAVAHDALDHT